MGSSCLLTRFEDLIADGEASSMRLVVGHKLDEELVPGGDYRRGGDLPAVLPHQLTALIHPIPHFQIVISAERQRCFNLKYSLKIYIYFT